MSTLKVDGIGKYDTTANAITFDSNNNASFTGRITAPNRIMFYVRKGSGSGDVTGVYTAQFDTKVFDVGNGFDTSTGLYTAPVAGNYLFSLCAFNDLGASGRIDWEKNGVVVGRFGRESSDSYYFSMEASIIIDMAVNDTIEGNVSSGNMHINSGYNYFSGFLIG